MQSIRSRSAALAVLPLGAISLSFVPAFSGLAILLWGIGLALMAASVVYNLQNRRTGGVSSQDDTRPRTAPYIAIALIVVGGLVGALITGASPASANTGVALKPSTAVSVGSLATGSVQSTPLGIARNTGRSRCSGAGSCI
ncbi:hypothetical protein GCM10025867_27610 [Frondihabitans sucicola]|uniref:DUF308 domain-containing protein n=1 Tax=Frondihabitans sucicola TaxID=1268041 RepID=A0ABM8GPY6_9MICO|nr:hypothetical protein [Frondihabitans sucicola]BDZ50520.1 hypothetical protein GCM10025867_27610 [Frondihabitans sucicola]